MSFLKSFGEWALFQTIFIYIVEVTGHKERFSTLYWISHSSIACVTLVNPYCLGKIVATTIIIYLLPNWRHFELCLGLASLVPCLLIWFIPESPRWLLSKY